MKEKSSKSRRKMGSPESGSVLAYVLVALGLSAGVVASTTKILDSNSRATKKIEVRGSVDSVQRIIQKTFSCEKSLHVASGTTLPACPANEIDIRDAHERSLVDSKGKLGKLDFYLKANCSTSGITFEYMRAREDKGKVEPLPDPLTGEKKGYSSLFKNKFFCTGFFPGATPEAPTNANWGLPTVACAEGRAWAGTKDGVPLCASTTEGLRAASTCTPGTLPLRKTWVECFGSLCITLHDSTVPGTPGTCGPGIVAPAPKCSMTTPKTGIYTEVCK